MTVARSQRKPNGRCFDLEHLREPRLRGFVSFGTREKLHTLCAANDLPQRVRKRLSVEKAHCGPLLLARVERVVYQYA
jgi:hypothetical protein